MPSLPSQQSLDLTPRPKAVLGLVVVAALLVGCPPVQQQDYYQLAPGNHWEYYMSEGTADGVVWDLEVLNADDNEETSRGDLWVVLTRTEPPQAPGFDPLVVRQRSFNIDREQSVSDGETTDLGWVYKWVQSDEEGERNEYFVKTPSGASDWSDSWEFDVFETVGNSQFYFDIEAHVRTEPLQTPYGTYLDSIEYVRTVEIEHNNGEVDRFERVETWAAGVGLIRYQITAENAEGEETVTEGLLRTTNVAPIPGSE